MTAVFRHIKSVIPNSWKFPFWFIFKSPQRKLGWFTLKNDLSALLSFCFYRFIRPKKLQKISICTGLYNRSAPYLDQLIGSIENARHKDLIELSVFDCGSDDVKDLEKKIREKWNGSLVFHSKPVRFSRSFSFNRAVEQSRAEIIFICDADMSIPRDIVSLCNHYTSRRLVWYPIVFYLFQDKPAVINKKNGEWLRFRGKGMLACRREAFFKVGKLNERFTEWGREDDELWERFMKAGFHIIRNRQEGLVHKWHPPIGI